MIYNGRDVAHYVSTLPKNKTHQFDLCQGQVGINGAKVQLFFLIASILRKKSKK